MKVKGHPCIFKVVKSKEILILVIPITVGEVWQNKIAVIV